MSTTPEPQPPDDIDLLLARLGLHVATDPMRVVDEWTQVFEQMRKSGREDACARLLAAVKGWALPDAQAGIVAFSDGWLLARRRQSRRAIKAFGRAQRAFERAGIDRAIPMVLVALAAEHELLGQFDEAAATLNDAERLTDPAIDASGAARIALDSVTLQLNKENLDDADLRDLQSRVESAIETFRDREEPVNGARARVALARVLARLRRAGDAQRELVAAMSEASAAGDLLTHHQAVGELGHLMLEAGHLDEASRLLETALEGLLAVGDLSSVGRTHATLAAVADLRGEPDGADHHREEALITYDALEDRGSAQRMRELLGRRPS